MSREERQNASDLLRGSDLYFGHEVAFTEVFPQIANLRIQVDQVEAIWGQPRSPGPHVFSMDRQPGEVVDCQDPRCYGGGLQLGELLRDVVRQKRTELETSKRCCGYEGSPKGQRRYRNCLTLFKVRIQLTYREESTSVL